MPKAHPPLGNTEFSLVHFTLRMREKTLLTPQMLLGMRNGLKKAARRLDAETDQGRLELIDPAIPFDPWSSQVRKKPAPPFAFIPPGLVSRELGPEEPMALAFCFWGRGIQQLPLFAGILRELGRQGLEKGVARFDLTGIDAEDATGSSTVIWREKEDFEAMAPPIIPVEWWLENLSLSGPRLTLRFHTPARLISQNKPLFQPGFAEIFPFMLRRVTSILKHYCDFGQEVDGRHLVELAAELTPVRHSLSWQDWKNVGGQGPGAVGGVVGDLEVEGAGLRELLWIIALGSLLNIGKGAAFGAGNYTLEAPAAVGALPR
ncbi:MAG: CRISPR system precrRNA processing endoribonuclease RAMP protein Cas6 [Deltaproteobacteria bacterium]|nr:CRISPR system precrRNA processing endoribonuclease RAMP protein Cas6 [Deltaproteobacteria bacterium]